MNYVSVCSGIEAASQAWSPLGFKALLFAEIDKFCSAVLKHHHPDVENVGDFTLIGDLLRGTVDILVGGTPCQSFSIAGLRGGMGDSRGNLALEFLRLVDRLKPVWIAWENVPGVLSSASHDAPDEVPPGDDLEPGQTRDIVEEYEADERSDFGCFLSGLQELGYGYAWTSLDAQYFDLAQRRERLFVVGHHRDARCAQAVLFDSESLFWNHAPRREKGKVAPTIPARSTGGGGFGGDAEVDGMVIPIPYNWPTDVAPTLNAHFGEKLGLEDQHIRGGAGLFVYGRPGVRRLTVIECCRLQGFPDTFLHIDYRRRKIDEENAEYLMSHKVHCWQEGEQWFTKAPADGPMYRALGNSMAVPVMRWIGERIKMVEGLEK